MFCNSLNKKQKPTSAMQTTMKPM